MLRPIVCVGETLEQREKGEVEKVLASQLRGSLAEVDAKELHETVIAYEPVWAIGTGKTATAAQAQEAHAFIRRTLGEMSDDATAEKIRIQYGGSVKPDNARELLCAAGHRWRARRRRQSRSAQLCPDRAGRRAERRPTKSLPNASGDDRRQGVDFHQANAGRVPGAAYDSGVTPGCERLQHG